jgi:hypothetical protein
MPKKYRILTPATLLLVIHIKAAMAGTHGAAIDIWNFAIPIILLEGTAILFQLRVKVELTGSDF